MIRSVKAFAPDVTFESNTTYIGDRKVYHIYPEHAQTRIRCWYTVVQREDPPVMAAFALRNLENVTIDLGGAKLLFHGRIMPFFLENCRNVTFRNFSIDYDRPFFTQGTVTDADAGSVTLDIPEAFRYRVENGGFIAESDFWENSLHHGAPLFQPYDGQTMNLSRTCPMMLGVIGDEINPQENPPCPIHHLHAEQLSGRKVRLTGLPDFFTPRTGEIIAFTHENRHRNGFQVENCTDTCFENIRIHHVGAVSLLANLCHNLTFRNFSCYVDDESNGRIITSNADILHGFHCTGHILAEDCRFENMLDDALNFHGNYALCEQALDARSFISVNKAAEMYGMPMYLSGDTIFVYRGSTQELKAAYTVTAAGYLPGDVFRQTISVREPLHDFEPGDIIESQRMAEMTIRRCTSAHCRGGWRISTGKKVLMEDCRIENSPVMFTGDTNYWYENTGVRDVAIRRCAFSDFSGAPISATPVFTPTVAAPFYHSGVRILNNTFDGCRGPLLHMERTDGIEFRGNACSGDQKMVLKNCGCAAICE